MSPGESDVLDYSCGMTMGVEGQTVKMSRLPEICVHLVGVHTAMAREGGTEREE